MIKQVLHSLCTYLGVALSSILLISILSQPLSAQTTAPESANKFESLQSDVGIHGLTVNMHQLGDVTYKGSRDTLRYYDSSELEFVYRNVRMMFQRLGVGYQVVTSFYTGGDGKGFGVGSWGAGPIIRAYPFRSDQVQPYLQLNSLFGNNLGVGKLANTRNVADGFRIRLGARAGVAVRLTNNIGLFAEAGYDWESSRFFRADARAFQANIGIDLYLFDYLIK
jgi:hypothetical protein